MPVPTGDIICVLDDELCVLKALGRLLASEGLRTEKFCEPAGFLEYARKHPVRVALIDIRMPGMTGIEVLAELRTILPGARVIVMTGENDPAHRAAALGGGASAFFLKPFDDDALLQAVRKAIAPAV
ncbi:MAG TPA: response regulator [Chthoniobacteraceae bacterium]|nr:response regulator [Chthoniobacteraceae bacterium]